MKLYTIIPTYNEKENIGVLIPAINEQYAKNSILGGVIVVDDNSPDGTQEIIQTVINSNTDTNFEIIMIKRAGKLGLGTAYLEGFQKALALGADYILEMDADFSHNPEYIKDFYVNLQTYDVVIGSRYIKGGSVVNWSPIRKLISKSGSLYSRIILGWKIRDATAGFVGYRRKVLEEIDLKNIKSNGYSFQVEMKYRAHQLGFSLFETPIIFPDRIRGTSKMSGNIVLEAMFKVFRLRFTK